MQIADHLTRAKLHQLVWERPFTQVAEALASVLDEPVLMNDNTKSGPWITLD